ncbi:MAG: peptidylprolyl isomerase [Flavobacteriaceae bacterium]|nr:MAG: peptidylprolyl isomerase [Flavobacteriaceae bacterium]
MLHKVKILKCISLSLIYTVVCIQQAHSQKIKIDGVGVVVGKNIVLDSDIEKFKLELENNSEGKIKISDCEMLEQLMLQKLLAHHAVIDSIVVTDTEVNAAVENNINYFAQQYGGKDKVPEIYGFNSIGELKTELFKIEKENVLIKKEQQKLTEKIDVTPEEVRLYYNGLKEKNELPEFPAEIQLAQIVVYAKPTEEENQRVINELSKLKKDIEEGASIRMKAIINSEDPAVTTNGGKYEITKDSPFIKEFKETVFSLEIGEVSEPFETDFGYHIIQLHEIKGNTRSASHILLRPQIDDNKLTAAQNLVTQIRKDITAGKITFEEAVKKYSEDKDTKNNGGLIVNPYTGESTFDLTRMDPALYARVNNLQSGKMTEPFYDETRTGEKMHKVIMMRDRTDTHIADLVDDYVKIHDLALQKKKQETIAKWAKEKIVDTYVKIGREYDKCTFDRNWKKLANR